VNKCRGEVHTTKGTLDGFVLSPQERKKSLTRGHVKDIGSATDIQSYRGQGYEGTMSGNYFANSRHLHLYVMVLLSGARVVRARWAWEASPCLIGGPGNAMGVKPSVIGVYVRLVEHLQSAS